MNGLLFTQDFLLKGIQDTPVWTAWSDDAFGEVTASLHRIYAPYASDSVVNEATTESEIILKTLGLLGWDDLVLPQVTASGSRREDVPDMLLFPDDEAKQRAIKEKREDRRYRHGIAVLEAKRWMRPLDRGEATDRLDPGTPSNQILRYLSSVEVASDRAVRWGILTNGRVWRLYYQGARSRSEEFLEIDVGSLLGVPGIQTDAFDGEPAQGLKLFLCLFHRGAFLTQSWDSERRSFHAIALAETRQYEERVSQDLGSRVFATVFPDLANALASGDSAAPKPLTRTYLDEVRDAALILLYRLLFVLYAEDRALLPIRDKRYYDYSLRRIREEVRDKRDRNDAFSNTAARTWDDLRNLFAAIASGDSALGLPAYNGGLFDDARTPLLARSRIPDSVLAPVVDELSRRSDLPRAWINYRDLSVQHLGSIYERLLEYRLDTDGDRIVPRPTSFARKDTGSYYTHDDLVKLIIGETVGPLLEERKLAFENQLKKWKARRELSPADWKALDELDPASRALELRICDPAMGSGHFLVSLVDYVADRILESISHAAEVVGSQLWSKDVQNRWVSPLVERIADVRKRIIAGAGKQGWTVALEHLDDRHIVRRMILKRVIHGVDKNPMAVELAKVALWLHTFTVGAPLSFLDHHLRCGDALFGSRVSHLRDALAKLPGGLLQQDDLKTVETARMTMQAIGELTDIDIAEAHQSRALMDQIQDSLRPQQHALDFLQARRWASKAESNDYEQTWVDVLNHEYGENVLESIELLSKRGIRLHGERQKRAHRVMQSARGIAEETRFLHWELAFPTIWPGAGYGEPSGGFDAVIGNPPWDRMKLQEQEWFAERRPEIGRAARAKDRKRMITELQIDGDPLWDDYQQARDAAETAARVARDCGDYPLLSGGDINLYSLFVERAQSLVNKQGIVGLITPSGIAADKGAAEFFRSISTTGRLSALLDFENKKNFFKDIHSNIKFCILVFSKAEGRFSSVRCAFFLENVSDISLENRLITVSAEDIASMNPNTGTLPVFRVQHDAEILAGIYHDHPVLVDRRAKPPNNAWPVRYFTMFHMTNDSNLFLRREELEKQGWYPVDQGLFKKGAATAVPLYVGRMIWHYDHRSASVGTNEDNALVSTITNESSSEEKADPQYVPKPQYWVSVSDLPESNKVGWFVGYRAISNPTNARTLIAAIVPAYAAGNSLPLLLANGVMKEEYAQIAPLLIANLNSLALDYVTRIKMQWTNLNWYMVEQLPVIRIEKFQAKIGETTIADFIRGEVLRLSYTAHDLKPFARDQGYDGPPFKWDENDRRHRMARLDALFFQLYGIERDDAAYILNTFPIVREHDEKAFGRYLTKDLVLAYMNAVAAGDLTTVVSV